MRISDWSSDVCASELFASNGFAVLSIQRPAPVGALLRPKDYVEVDRINLQGLADRQNVLSVVEQGVRLPVDRGIADPKAIGITGRAEESRVGEGWGSTGRSRWAQDS